MRLPGRVKLCDRGLRLQRVKVCAGHVVGYNAQRRTGFHQHLHIQGAAKKNVPRQKLRFLKSRSVNLNVIFIHCKERVYINTYLDNM